MNKILIVEDDNDINQMMCDMLSKNGYECVQAFSGTEGLLHAKSTQFNLAILDLMLPGMDGKTLTGEIRKFSNMPIIIASAKDELNSKVELLVNGADDYITKPFEMKELLARVMVHIRRATAPVESENLSYKNMILDKELFRAKISGTTINLTKQEFKILELLFTYPSRVFRKKEIYDYAWEDYYVGEDKTVNVHISNIRHKIKAVTEEEYIETVWGIGFKLHD